ncbi:uncharacterized protein SCODWIG_01829 [Saccharomycodes ludwigii]|uniref:HECT domain-containing protein n=1 Tax=Saccharomycodes ludwigii TaxID=36035 RepID=A0A376B5V5_9ASCO|nr:uncharacterized protein SCODWIG_01829 [Saccharomycodes ludwigii]
MSHHQSSINTSEEDESLHSSSEEENIYGQYRLENDFEDDFEGSDHNTFQDNDQNLVYDYANTEYDELGNRSYREADTLYYGDEGDDYGPEDDASSTDSQTSESTTFFNRRRTAPPELGGILQNIMRGASNPSQNSEGFRNIGLSELDVSFLEIIRNLNNELEHDDNTSNQPNTSSNSLHSLRNRILELSNGTLQNRHRRIHTSFFRENIFGAEREEEREQMKILIENIKNAENDPYIAMETLNQINDIVLYTVDDDFLDLFDPKILVENIASIIRSEPLKCHYELHVAASRCLANICRSNDSLIWELDTDDFFFHVKQRMVNLEVIDVVESYIDLVNALSSCCTYHILNDDILPPVYAYFDFFNKNTQIKIIEITNTCFKHCAPDIFEPVGRVISSLQDLLLVVRNNNITGGSGQYNTSSISGLIFEQIIHSYHYVCARFTNIRKLNLSKLFDLEHFTCLLNILQGKLSIKDDIRVEILDILTHTFACDEMYFFSMVDSETFPNFVLDVVKKYSIVPNEDIRETLLSMPKKVLSSLSKFIMVFLSSQLKYSFMKFRLKPSFNIQANNKKLCSKFIASMEDLFPILMEIFSISDDYEISRYTLIGIYCCVCEKQFVESSTVLYKSEFFTVLSARIYQRHKSFVQAESLECKLDDGLFLLHYMAIVKELFEKNCELQEVFEKEGIFDICNLLKAHLLTNSVVQQDAGRETKDKRVFFRDLKEVPSKNNTAITGFHDGGRHFHFETTNADDMVYFKGTEVFNEADDLCAKDFRFISEKEFANNGYVPQIKFDILEDFDLQKASSALYGITSTIFMDKSLTNIKNKALERDVMEASKILLLQHFAKNGNSISYWQSLWSSFKEVLFGNLALVSSYDLSNSGVLKLLHDILVTSPRVATEQFINVLEGAHCFPTFVKLLHATVLRTASFRLLDLKLPTANGSKEIELFDSFKLYFEFEEDFFSDQAMYRADAITVQVLGIMLAETISTALKAIERKRIRDPIVLNILDASTYDFQFSYKGVIMPDNITLLGFLFNELMKNNGGTQFFKKDIYHFKCKRIEIPDKRFVLYPSRFVAKPIQHKYVDSIHNSNIDLEQALEITLDLLNTFAQIRPDLHSKLVSSELTNKLLRQIKNPMILHGGLLPEWIPYISSKYSNIIHYNGRIKLFLMLINAKLPSVENVEDEMILDDIETPYFHYRMVNASVERGSFFSVLKLLSTSILLRNKLAISFIGEEASGPGPTLEFFSIACKQFSFKNWDIWRNSDVTPTISGFVLPSDDLEPHDMIAGDLYPKSRDDFSSEQAIKTLSIFHFLGRFVAKALHDNILLDFRFNVVFFKLALLYAKDGDSLKKNTLNDLQDGIDMIFEIDKHLGKTLQFLLDNPDKSEELNLPFYFKNNTSSGTSTEDYKIVNKDNVFQYLKDIIDYNIGSGVRPQIEAFIDGFSKLFPFDFLLLLTPEELVGLCGNVEEDWSYDTVFANIQPDHGYSINSTEIIHFVDILSSFTKHEKRLFLEFATSSPRLPIGGFKSLNPKLSIVLKYPENEDDSFDDILPSVMTCSNYFKLPKYSTREIMKDRIIQAITEGVGAFGFS